LDTGSTEGQPEVDPQVAARLLLSIPVSVLLAVALLDIYLETKTWPSISQRLQAWTTDHPVLAAGLVAVLGALVGHFLFWQRVVKVG
jgi:branched-subunit amino acid transport protein